MVIKFLLRLYFVIEDYLMDKNICPSCGEQFSDAGVFTGWFCMECSRSWL